jgi:cytochrome c oxidase subunit II
MEPKRRSQDWRHMLAIILVMAGLSAALVYLFLRVDFVPNPGSLERGQIDKFLKLLFAIASVFFAIIMTVFVYSLIFFRQRKGDQTDAKPIRGNTALEIAWTVVPLIIVMVLAVYAAGVLNNMSSPNPQSATQAVYSIGVFIPGEAPLSSANTSGELVINVTASRFAWQFEYPDYNINSYVLEVPVNQRILFNIHSEDVVHSFWVQEWGPKQDAVPGLAPILRITPTELGSFLVQCSQLCGYGHSDMTAPVQVVSATDFDTWVKQQQSSTPPTPAPGVHVMVDLMAQNIMFDKSTITVPAGAEVMINFDNKDAGVPHNFALYTDSSATTLIFRGNIITGPKTITYTFTAPATPGNYFFRCDVHPTMMTGTLVVQ